MTLSSKQSRAIATLTEKKFRYFADLKAYDDFRKALPKDWLIMSGTGGMAKLNSLQRPAMEAVIKLTQIENWIMMILHSEDNVDDILLEILRS